MRRLISYMFTSLDGFIADTYGGLDRVPIDDELMRFANDYFRGFHGILFGRNVYTASSRTGTGSTTRIPR